MTSFVSFLEEAKFSEENLKRLISVVEKRMPKLLGAPIYRFGGENGMEKVGAADGYLFFFGPGRAFRVRAKAGKVLGIDIWEHYHPNEGPSFTAELEGMEISSIINGISKLAQAIKAPSVGTIEIPAGSNLEEMAKRVDSQSFYELMVNAYGESGSKDVTWEQIKKVADDADVLIPAYIRDQKIGRGRWDATPPPPGSEPAAPAKKKDPILYIKVTAQDPDSKKFISTADSPEAQRLYTQLAASVQGPGTEAEVKDPSTLYGHMAQLVEMACKGSLRSLLIYGGPGTGKTFTIMETVQRMGMVKGQDYVKLSGKASPIEIYKTLFMYREKGLVIFDDLDSMWRNEDATNILKAALDTSPVREISWVSQQTINVSKMDDERKEKLFAQIDRQLNGEAEPDIELDDDDEGDDAPRKKKKELSTDPNKIKYPSTFDFKGRVVFISNLKKEDFDTAIMSRSAKINMDLTPQQILNRMRTILPTLGGTDVSVEQKEELLDHLLEMHKRKEITAITMREFTKGLDIVRSGVPNWKELVIYA